MEKKPQSNSAIVALKGYIGGITAGLTQLFVGQPFDTIKVRITANQKLTMTSAIQEIIKQDGLSGLYRGTLSPLVGFTGIISIQFGVFDNAKVIMQKLLNTKTLDIPTTALCGACGGLASIVVVAPVEHVRIKMQASGKFTSTIQCFKSIVKGYGITGLYRGLFATGCREFPGCGFYFMSYDALMQYFKNGWAKDKAKEKIAALIAGSCAGLAYWVPVFPVDNIKTRLQSDPLENPQYKGFFDCAMKTIKTGGIKNLYRGLLPCVLRSMPANAAGFLAFEETMNFINKHYHLDQQ